MQKGKGLGSEGLFRLEGSPEGARCVCGAWPTTPPMPGVGAGRRLLDPLHSLGCGAGGRVAWHPRGLGHTFPDQSLRGGGATSLRAVPELQRVADLGQKKGLWERVVLRSSRLGECGICAGVGVRGEGEPRVGGGVLEGRVERVHRG